MGFEFCFTPFGINWPCIYRIRSLTYYVTNITHRKHTELSVNLLDKPELTVIDFSEKYWTNRSQLNWKLNKTLNMTFKMIYSHLSTTTRSNWYTKWMKIHMQYLLQLTCLSFLDGPSVVTVKPLNKTYTIKEFDSLDPIVCFSSCVPSCSFYWTGPTISKLKRNPLHLTNAQRNQTGNYTCTTYNDVGVAHVRITITVLCKYTLKFVLIYQEGVLKVSIACKMCFNIGVTCSRYFETAIALQFSSVIMLMLISFSIESNIFQSYRDLLIISVFLWDRK